MRRHLCLPSTLLLIFICIQIGCAPAATGKNARSGQPKLVPGGPQLQLTEVGDLSQLHPGPATLAGAKNEWLSIAVVLPELKGNAYRIAIRPPSTTDGVQLSPNEIKAYQILPMPVDVNRAGYVRHTGNVVTSAQLPRALLPIPLNDGSIDVSSLRDASQKMIWIDLHLPPETAAGTYEGAVELIDSSGKELYSSMPIQLTVNDFALPDERHLLMVSRIEWDRLKSLYPMFETVEPYLMSRNDPRYDPAVKVLDDLVTLAQSHRVQVVIPRLTPIVKWPTGRPPQVYWNDYDSVVSPWLGGEVFFDRQPLGYWPLPKASYLDNYPPQARMEYWSEAASHFDAANWLSRTAVLLEREKQGRATAADSVLFSAEAARVLNTHPRVRVTLPLEEQQVVSSSQRTQNAINVEDLPRVFAAAPGLVSNGAFRPANREAPRPLQWLRTDIPGLVPYAGAGGDERDVRLWAWLAYLRKAEIIYWTGALPQTNTPKEAADPNELIWFYPGSWFGVEEPVPTVQLKWLRRAQQDFEYLRLASQRGQTVYSVLMARLITKPVEIQLNQFEDPVYALMSGTTDAKAWADAYTLLAKYIMLLAPGEAPDRTRNNALDLETLQWAKPIERPTLVGRTTQWLLDDPKNFSANSSFGARLGIDIYNASDYPPAQNTLQYQPPYPPGWEVRPQPITIPSLGLYHVERFSLDAKIDPNKLRNGDRQAVHVRFTNGYNNQLTDAGMAVPVATSDRLPPGLLIDGQLNDWHPDDQILDGPMVQLFTRPSLQAQELKDASTSSQLFTGWADDHFYVGFKLNGLLSGLAPEARNFVDYQFRRAWGEDLCEILIQPVYTDNTLGPVLHVVCKPNGVTWIERRMILNNPNAWEAFQGAGVRYSTTLDNKSWRGEVAIPWTSIADPAKGRPALLRFNVVQHKNETGESASWAGPIDFGRDDSFTGALFVRDPINPNMRPDRTR